MAPAGLESAHVGGDHEIDSERGLFSDALLYRLAADSVHSHIGGDEAFGDPATRAREGRAATMTAMPPSASTEAATPGWIWGPAGRDVELARAISDLTTGGYLGSTRVLLALNRVPAVYDRRGYCSSVLAAMIVRLGLPGCEHWLADGPRDPDALLMHARVQVVRAVHAARAESHDAARLASTAAQACERAADAAPEDPPRGWRC